MDYPKCYVKCHGISWVILCPFAYTPRPLDECGAVYRVRVRVRVCVRMNIGFLQKAVRPERLLVSDEQCLCTALVIMLQLFLGRAGLSCIEFASGSVAFHMYPLSLSLFFCLSLSVLCYLSGRLRGFGSGARARLQFEMHNFVRVPQGVQGLFKGLMGNIYIYI